MRGLTEEQQDYRDLQILRLWAEGKTSDEIQRIMNDEGYFVTRGIVAGLVNRDVKEFPNEPLRGGR